MSLRRSHSRSQTVLGYNVWRVDKPSIPHPFAMEVQVFVNQEFPKEVGTHTHQSNSEVTLIFSICTWERDKGKKFGGALSKLPPN